MERFSIRPFKERDIDLAYKLDMMEHWNDTRDDIKRMFSYQPGGCFIAEIDHKAVGHIFSISYGRLGWIGLLIVKTRFRRRGVGTLLLKSVMDLLLSHKVKTIRLEAVSTIAGWYRKLGFVDEYHSLRFSGFSRKMTTSSFPHVKPLKKEEITEIAEFDVQYFGADRIEVLTALHQDNPELCYVSHKGSEIVGYIMGRKAENGHRIGPWVCNPENPIVARELLIKCMETIGRDEKVYMGVPAVNKAGVEILQDFGFERYSKSIRMLFYAGVRINLF